MAGETAEGQGTGGTSGATDNVIGAIFGGEPPKETGAGGEGGGGGEDQSREDGEWKAGYVPKAFRSQSGEFHGDQDKVFKSWMDGRQEITRQAARIKELEAEGKATLPPTDTPYADEFDYKAVHERAPNAGVDPSNGPLVALLKLGHKHGLPQKAHQAMVAEYYEMLSKDIGEHKDD